jgi:hypothetical protein
LAETLSANARAPVSSVNPWTGVCRARIALLTGTLMRRFAAHFPGPGAPGTAIRSTYSPRSMDFCVDASR